MNAIEDMKKKRFQFLHRLYELTGGDEFKGFNMFQIGEELGFDRNLTTNIAYYLKGEGLIEFRALGGIIGISHLGVREVEEALSKPDTSTYHFLPVNIISVGQMISSQIQQTSPEATQVVTVGESRHEELKEVIQSLKKSIEQLGLSPQQKSDLQAEIQTIDAQMSSSKPKATIITECLGTIRRILEGAVSSTIASGLLSKIVALLGG
jgi:hypothetical protein